MADVSTTVSCPCVKLGESRENEELLTLQIQRRLSTVVDIGRQSDHQETENK